MKKALSTTTASLLTFSLAACSHSAPMEPKVLVPENTEGTEEMMDDKAMDHGHDHDEGMHKEEAMVEEAEEESEHTERHERTQSAVLAESSLSFTGTKGPVMSQPGSFTDYSVTLTRDGDTPTSLEVRISIDSIVTNSQGLTDHLKAHDFFDVANFPEAVFASKYISPKGDNVYRIEGDLAMHGVTNGIGFEASITDSQITGELVLDRTLFGIGPAAGGVKGIDAAVPVVINVSLQ